MSPNPAPPLPPLVQVQLRVNVGPKKHALEMLRRKIEVRGGAEEGGVAGSGGGGGHLPRLAAAAIISRAEGRCD